MGLCSKSLLSKWKLPNLYTMTFPGAMHVDFLSTNSAKRKICQLPRHKYHLIPYTAPAAKCSLELWWVSGLMQSCRIEEIPQDDRVKSYSFTLSICSKITSINKILRYLSRFFTKTHVLMNLWALLLSDS